MEAVKFREGYWMVRVVRHGPEVCARIWKCWHEPSIPENLMDRPYWQGQLGLDLIDPAEIWAMLEYVEASPEEQRLMREPPLSERTPRAGRHAAFTTAPMAAWKRERARRISAAEYAYQIADFTWLQKHRPQDPKAKPTEKVQLRNLDLPF